MKKITFTFLTILTISIISNAQIPTFAWAKSTGGTAEDSGNSIAVDSLGNVYTTGYFNGTVDFDPGAGMP